jgi:hypothetical protein
VPTISAFFGMLMTMYWREHGPPHFHAKYRGMEATVAIATGEVLRGSLPPRARSLVTEWVRLHHRELEVNWRLCRRNETPRPIPPLE